MFVATLLCMPLHAEHDSVSANALRCKEPGLLPAHCGLPAYLLVWISDGEGGEDEEGQGRKRPERTLSMDGWIRQGTGDPRDTVDSGPKEQ